MILLIQCSHSLRLDVVNLFIILEMVELTHLVDLIITLVYGPMINVSIQLLGMHLLEIKKN